MPKEALLYKKLDNNIVECGLCNHFCRIKDGQTGICGVRQNRKGVLYSLNYGKLVALHIDPIEKKPLFHFLPESNSYSIASVGCNFKCGFCQNWQISQSVEARRIGVDSVTVQPQEVVEEAVRSKCESISYTYTEPTIFFEFAQEVAALANKQKLYNVFVTNGYMNSEALKLISPYLDAANVDLKSFKESFYKEACKAHLKPVLDNIELMKKINIWVEVTTLVIPDMNDSDEELSSIASFIASLDVGIPWHISRFYPSYKFNNSSATEAKSLERAYEIGKSKGLRYVYIGNYYTDFGENTYCYNCSKILIERVGFSIRLNNIKEGRCSFCGTTIEGIFK